MKNFLVTYTLLRNESGNIPADSRKISRLEVAGNRLPNNARTLISEELDVPLSYIGIVSIEEARCTITEYDNRHAYTVEREREEEPKVINSALMGEEKWLPVHSCGQAELVTVGNLTGYVMTNGQGLFAIDTIEGNLVAIPAHNRPPKPMPTFAQ
jgi:hypothetical protein